MHRLKSAHQRCRVEGNIACPNGYPHLTHPLTPPPPSAAAPKPGRVLPRLVNFLTRCISFASKLHLAQEALLLEKLSGPCDFLNLQILADSSFHPCPRTLTTLQIPFFLLLPQVLSARSNRSERQPPQSRPFGWYSTRKLWSSTLNPVTNSPVAAPPACPPHHPPELSGPRIVPEAPWQSVPALEGILFWMVTALP
jgi:hypothetical protein